MSALLGWFTIRYNQRLDHNYNLPSALSKIFSTMQFSFILSALAFVTTVTSTQELKAAIKAIRPNIDDDVVHEAATGYLQALSLLGAAEADDGSDPKLVSIFS